MPSDVFWTGLFAFSGGLVGGGAGYVTARLQHTLQVQQLALDERRLELEQLQSQVARGDAHWEQRKLTYLRYLTALDGLLMPIVAGSLEPDHLQPRYDKLLEAHCEVELAAGIDVNDSAYALSDLISRLVNEVRELLARPSPGQAIAALAKERKDEIRDVRRELVRRMYEDLQRLWPAGEANVDRSEASLSLPTING